MKKNEDYFIDPSHVIILSRDQWKILIEVHEKHANDNNDDDNNMKKK